MILISLTAFEIFVNHDFVVETQSIFGINSMFDSE